MTKIAGLPRILNDSQLTAYIGVSRSHIYKMIARGEFPRSIRFGRSYGWRRAEIEAWIEAKAANERPSIKGGRAELQNGDNTGIRPGST